MDCSASDAGTVLGVCLVDASGGPESVIGVTGLKGEVAQGVLVDPSLEPTTTRSCGPRGPDDRGQHGCGGGREAPPGCRQGAQLRRVRDGGTPARPAQPWKAIHIQRRVLTAGVADGCEGVVVAQLRLCVPAPREVHPCGVVRSRRATTHRRRRNSSSNGAGRGATAALLCWRGLTGTQTRVRVALELLLFRTPPRAPVPHPRRR